MEHRLGSAPGLFRRATVIKYNEDGTVLVALDEAGLHQPPQRFTVPLPLAWAGQEGEFIGGYPRSQSSVLISQGQGGQWFIVSYLPARDVFDKANISLDNTTMSALKPGRALMQVKNGNCVMVDPDSGIHLGDENKYIQANPNRNILSHNFNTFLEFTDSHRIISGAIKRDLVENNNRNILGSTLDSQSYEASLFTIGLDPSTSTTPISLGGNVKNPALAEVRELVYEFPERFLVGTDEDELLRYENPSSSTQPKKGKPRVNRREMRSDAINLGLEHPNHLMESVKGTLVDTFGNILDINRNPLPIGKIDILSLRKNPDKADAYKRIRASLRKSVVYHWEINARKGESDNEIEAPPDVADVSDYARNRSRAFVDIDKEGQFKINIPASSESGNVPLLTRYENYSVLAANKDSSISPNSFIRSSTNQEIFLESFGKSSVGLSGSDTNLDGYEAPLDRITEKPIKYGTAYHDITKTCNEFLKSSAILNSGNKLINFDKNNPLNTSITQYEKIVSDNIIVTGPEANAGGRSGLLNLDGFLSINIGANTVDRQSLHFDYAGSVIGNIGRDKRGISYASSMDGDCILQIGGPGIGNSFDSRFATENDAYRNGTLDIRVWLNNQLMIFRMGPEGISIISPGRITMTCQQDMIFRSNTKIGFEAEQIVMHSETGKRIIQKFPNDSI